MNIQKKIAIVLPFFLDGGVERIMANLARGFVDRGIAVDFVFMTDASGPMRSVIPFECGIVEFKKGGIIRSLFPMIRYLRKKQPDAVLTALTPANMVAIWAKYLSGTFIRTIVSVHVSVKNAASTTLFKARLRPFVYSIFYRFADKVISVSQGIENDLKTFGIPVSKIETIYNPVVSKHIEDLAEKPIQHPWLLDTTVPLILGVGRLHPQKDFPTLIKAFAIAYNKRPLRLLVIGEGDERSSLEQLIQELKIQDVVSFTGFVQNPYAYMRRASVFVLSSAFEGLPTVLIEAIAVGVPCVSTDCPYGPREILEDGKYGILVPVGNASSLANAILATIEAPINRNILKQKGQDFMVDRAIERYLFEALPNKNI